MAKAGAGSQFYTLVGCNDNRWKLRKLRSTQRIFIGQVIPNIVISISSRCPPPSPAMLYPLQILTEACLMLLQSAPRKDTPWMLLPALMESA